VELCLIVENNILQYYKYFSFTLAIDKKCRYFEQYLMFGK